MLVFPALQVGRFARFAATEGGIEHDSGWYLGVARNLAERGLYATSTNMGKTSEPVTPGIHDRPTVQDSEGYSYFCSGVTVGPGFIVPEALVLKVLGVGWWSYRLLPLTVMFALLVLLSALAYLRGGCVAALLLQLWLWTLPTVTFNFAYEAYAEHVAFFYALLAVCVYARAVRSSSPKHVAWWAAGVLLGLAYLTKSVYLLTAIAMGLHWLWTIWPRRSEWRRHLRVALPVILGFLLPVILFEGYRFVTLVQQFGMDGYRANNKAFVRVFLSAGSGLGSSLWDTLGRVPLKLLMLENLGLRIPVFAWPLTLVACGAALRPVAGSDTARQAAWVPTVFQVAGIKIVLVMGWFVFVSSSIFTRHAWDGLVLIMLLICVGVADACQALLRRKAAVAPEALVVLLLATLNLACFDFALAEVRPWITFERAIQWLTPFRRPVQSLSFSPVFRKDLQEDAAAFLRREVKPEDRIYYIDRHKIAELPPLVDKVFFSIDRYAEDKRTRSGRAFIVLGPYQIGDWPWRLESEYHIQQILQAHRKQIVFQNDLYVVLQGPFQSVGDLVFP